MIKLAITHTNYAAAIHVDGGLETITYVVEIENEFLEEVLTPKKYTTITISKVEEKNG